MMRDESWKDGRYEKSGGPTEDWRVSSTTNGAPPNHFNRYRTPHLIYRSPCAATVIDAPASAIVTLCRQSQPDVKSSVDEI